MPDAETACHMRGGPLAVMDDGDDQVIDFLIDNAWGGDSYASITDVEEHDT